MPVKPDYTTFIYYVKGKNICRAPRAGKKGTKKVVVRNAISERKEGYLYYVKASGPGGTLKVHKSKMKRNSTQKKKKSSRSLSGGGYAQYAKTIRRVNKAIRDASKKSPRTGPKSVRNKWVKIKGTGIECNFYRRKCRANSRKR